MTLPILGLHHVTSIGSDPRANNHYFTETLGLRRVKKTVNFDRPDVYHLYFGTTRGAPGTLLTYFPFPGKSARAPGSGEVGQTAFAVPPGSFETWAARLGNARRTTRFGTPRLEFAGPDGEDLALVATTDSRAPWTGAGIAPDQAITGLHSVTLRLADGAATAELLQLMNYRPEAQDGAVTRLRANGGNGGNGADIVDIETRPNLPGAHEGRGAVHHVAFAVADAAAQLAARETLVAHGYKVTGVRDRSYFRAIYFRAPGGILFEIATNDPGFAVDEPAANLGTALKLPPQHQALRSRLEDTLPPL